jgi:putative membrane protein
MATKQVETEVRRSAEQAQEAAEQSQEAAVHTQVAATQTAAASRNLKDSADRRTELAANRTVFAAERTYAAWVRTGLASLASGVGAKALLEDTMPDWMILSTGSVLVLFSAFCFAAAVWRQLVMGAEPPDPDVRRIPPFFLLAINGFLVLAALAALFGIWFGNAGSS